eukprot:TRINITY_DN2511_c1_g1_i1.p2 TRINITY_DN2511_c1_g1~~TRINITY_DN2511_c1_g1_i1.p2  ORF type:complete len:142 (+),score=15.32 TRINITY_DN2511_c1_g1_i1:61-486(+)
MYSSLMTDSPQKRMLPEREAGGKRGDRRDFGTWKSNRTMPYLAPQIRTVNAVLERRREEEDGPREIVSRQKAKRVVKRSMDQGEPTSSYPRHQNRTILQPREGKSTTHNETNRHIPSPQPAHSEEESVTETIDFGQRGGRD